MAAGRRHHGLPRDAAATARNRNPSSALPLRGEAATETPGPAGTGRAWQWSMAAGRHHHGLPRDAAATRRKEERGTALRLWFQLSAFQICLRLCQFGLRHDFPG